MRKPDSHAGNWGWVGLTAGVVAWDILAPETLSNAVDRYMDDPFGRVAVLGTVAIVGAHLLNLFPEQYDPIELIGRGMMQLKELTHG